MLPIIPHDIIILFFLNPPSCRFLTFPGLLTFFPISKLVIPSWDPSCWSLIYIFSLNLIASDECDLWCDSGRFYSVPRWRPLERDISLCWGWSVNPNNASTILIEADIWLLIPLQKKSDFYSLFKCGRSWACGPREETATQGWIYSMMGAVKSAAGRSSEAECVIFLRKHTWSLVVIKGDN